MNQYKKSGVCIRKAATCLAIKKSHFGYSNVVYLGLSFSPKGIKPDPLKVHALVDIEDMGEPDFSKGIQRFLGLAGYFRQLIKDYAKRAKPLCEDVNYDQRPF
eukprot:GHVP01068955.1.p2 GENE.GHVP01068955.1~~GHVP01068955.1.p2  ORF type:complete len:103 (+),score=9.89 GHVP01068955.1:1387-1695(+)